MNGNESILKRKQELERRDDEYREKRCKTAIEQTQKQPIEFPRHNDSDGVNNSSPLGQLLDRSGGLARKKSIRPFQDLLLKEKHLKRRFAFLTVLQLTSKDLIQELLKQDLLSILYEWMQNATAVGSSVCTQFTKGLLNTLLGMDICLAEGSVECAQWKELFANLHNQELKTLSIKLLNQWSERNLQVSRRVEGLNSPIPKASSRNEMDSECLPCEKVTISIQPKKPNLCTTKKAKQKKKVTWAPPDDLVTIRVFHETDPPDQLLVSTQPIITNEVPFCPPKMVANLKWKELIEWKLDPSWSVKNGEESEEKKVQESRAQSVVAFDSIVGRTCSVTGTPEEPFYNDSCPSTNQSKHIQYL